MVIWGALRGETGAGRAVTASLPSGREGRNGSVPMATAGGRGGARGPLELPPSSRRPAGGAAMSLLRGPRPRGPGKKGSRKAATVKRDWDVSASPSRVPRRVS